METTANPIHDLMRDRAHHMDNLQRLKAASPTWDDRTRQRGEATMANLMQQVYTLDAQLRSAAANRGGAA